MTESSEGLLSIKTSNTTMETKGQAPIGIIGTGNYAISLTKKLISVGYRVVMGSRSPSKRESALVLAGSCLCGVEVTSIDRCVNACDVIFVAIHMEDYQVTLGRFARAARNKVFVDISNRENRYAKISNAQRLADILPNSTVVKAFNTVAPATMELLVNSVTSPKVYVASDDNVAKNMVMDVAKKMGFAAVDFGDLKSALYLEDFVLRVFTGWRIPIFLAFGIFNVWCLYIIYIYFVAKKAYKWEQLFLKVFNKPLCMTAITMVALTYMPGQIAAILQVIRGTKYQRFPRFLDGWLKCRKQLGLVSYALIVFHAIASTLMMNPTYYRSWFHQPEVTILVNATLTSAQQQQQQLTLPVSTAWMVWKGELALLLGVSAFVAVSILAVTSIPSVADALNWSEWRCVHSKLGTGFMLLSVGHVCAMGAPGWAKAGWVGSLQSITFLSLVLPVLVLLSKTIFFLSPLRCYLKKIRRGWERDAGKDDSSTAPAVFHPHSHAGHQEDKDQGNALVDINGGEEVGLVEEGFRMGRGLSDRKCRCCRTRSAPVASSGNNGQCACSSV